MQERKLNMFAKQEEYMALRQYIRLVSDASGGAAGALRRAINSELTKRQKQLIGMYYIAGASHIKRQPHDKARPRAPEKRAELRRQESSGVIRRLLTLQPFNVVIKWRHEKYKEKNKKTRWDKAGFHSDPHSGTAFGVLCRSAAAPSGRA